jgi:hypothetical protein
MFNEFSKGTSIQERGTLFQIKEALNIIHAKPKKVAQSFNHCQDLIEVV